MIIIHGDDVKKSYDRLTVLLKTYKENGVNTFLHQVSELTPTSLRQELESTDLFAGKNAVVIYGLISSTKSKTRDSIIKILENTEGEAILYEEKELTATQLKSFPKAKVEVFKIPTMIFKFLETIRPGEQKIILTAYDHLINQKTEPEFIYAMLVRQIRMLILAKDKPDSLKTSPYAKKMFVSQSSYFRIDQLLDLHHKLYRIDKKIKTGSTMVDTNNLVFHFLQSI